MGFLPEREELPGVSGARRQILRAAMSQFPYCLYAVGLYPTPSRDIHGSIAMGGTDTVTDLRLFTRVRRRTIATVCELSSSTGGALLSA